MTTPIFAQPTPDENLKPGWNVQGTTYATGPDAPGYAQPAITATEANVGQDVGPAFPPGAANANPSEDSAAYTQSLLTNGSYSEKVTTMIGATQSLSSTYTGVPFGTAYILASGEVTYLAPGETGSGTAVTAAGTIIPAGSKIVSVQSAATVVSTL